MPRSVKNLVLLVKLETTSGTDAAPTNTADAVLYYAGSASFDTKPLFAERDVSRGTYGAPDKLLYSRRGEISFEVDLASSGTAGTAPALAPLLKLCGVAETVTASTRVDYTPISTGQQSATVWGYLDGELHKFVYCLGDAEVVYAVGQMPKLKLTINGLLVADPSAAAVPTPTLTAWKRPPAVGPLATSAVTLGGTYSAGAISGGTAYNFMDFSLKLGNDIQPLSLAASEINAIDDRRSSCEFTLDLTAAAAVSLHADMKAGTQRSVGLVHGTTAGQKSLVFGAFGVITGIERAPQGNKLLQKVTMDLPPSVGNDEWRLVFL